MFVFVLAHLLFWYRGGVIHGFAFENLYSDDKFNHDGGIPSGPSGSGIFPISLLLMCSVTVTVLAKIAVFVPENRCDNSRCHPDKHSLLQLDLKLSTGQRQ